MNELQTLVDALALELDRPVGVDDRSFRSLAYSKHDDGIDIVRRNSILRREAPRAVTEWLRSLDIERATEHVRVPRNKQLGMDARVCVPVRFGKLLLGYLWLIDEPEPLDDAAIDRSHRCATKLATEIVRLRRAEDQDRERETVLLDNLLLSASDPAQAAAHLTDGPLATTSRYIAIVARVWPRSSLGGDDDTNGATDDALRVRVRLALAADQVRRSVAPRHALSLGVGHETVVVLAFDGPRDPNRLAEVLLSAARQQFGDDGSAVVCTGIGGVRRNVAELRGSYREARHAARVAQKVPGVDGDSPVAWETLSAYRTITEMLGDRCPEPFVPEPLLRLLKEREGETLVATVETYLELAGDASAAAARLFVHRSSLYNRLHRVEESTGWDLNRGDHRLELHLGLRLWRLSGGGASTQQS